MIDQSFDWSVKKSHCQINVVRRYVLTSKMNFSFFPVVVFRGSYFIKAKENFFPVFAEPDINTRGAGRILDSYANPRLRLGFA